MRLKAAIAMMVFLLLSGSAVRADDLEKHLSAGNKYYDAGDFEKALGEFQAASESVPNRAESHFSIGHVYFKLGKYDEALESFKQALVLKPNYSDAYYHTAVVYAAKREVKPAVAALKRAIELHKEFTDIAKRDPDFANIRSRSEFRDLIEGNRF